MRAGGPVRQPYAGVDFIHQSWIFESGYCTSLQYQKTSEEGRHASSRHNCCRELLRRRYFWFSSLNDIFFARRICSSPVTIPDRLPPCPRLCLRLVRPHQVLPPPCQVQCCGSGMFIPVLVSRIQKQQQKRGVKIFFMSYIFCSDKYHKIEYYFLFELAKKKIWAYIQRIIEFLPTKLSLSSQKYRLGSGIREPN
jgi:hypothetical protein